MKPPSPEIEITEEKAGVPVTVVKVTVLSANHSALQNLQKLERPQEKPQKDSPPHVRSPPTPASSPSPRASSSSSSSSSASARAAALTPQQKIDQRYRKAAGAAWRSKQSSRLASFEEGNGVHPVALLKSPRILGSTTTRSSQSQNKAALKATATEATTAAANSKEPPSQEWWRKSKIWEQKKHKPKTKGP